MLKSQTEVSPPVDYIGFFDLTFREHNRKVMEDTRILYEELKSITMANKKISAEEFTRLFKVKPFKGQFSCYGTWNCLDMSELGDTPENARIEMWNKLKKANWV